MAPHVDDRDVVAKPADAVVAAPAAAASEMAAPSADKMQSVFEYSPPSYFGAESRVPAWLQPWLADAFMFGIYHYNLWAIPVLAFFYYLYQVRLCVHLRTSSVLRRHGRSCCSSLSHSLS